MTCKDCIHKRVCEALIKQGLPYNDGKLPAEAFCMTFKDKSRIIELPCKVGTTLYFFYDRTFANRPNITPHIYETNDWYFDIDQKGVSILPRSIHSYQGKHHYYLGETVFLTKKEAEAKLKELNENK